MKYGYMPSFGVDLLLEIDFAKRHFDFIEITSKLDLSEYTPKYISKLNAALKNYEVLGHIHWEIDLSKGTCEVFKKIYKTIRVFRKLGIRKITIHPSTGEGQNIIQIKQNNLFALSKITDFCRKNKSQLLVENITTIPFNRSSELNSLVRHCHNLGITLDIGHAYRTSRFEVNRFFRLIKKVKHIHLHDISSGQVHLPFRNKAKLKQLINKIKSAGYDATVTLEIFSSFRNNKPVPVDGEDRRDLLIKQLELIRKYTGINRDTELVSKK